MQAWRVCAERRSGLQPQASALHTPRLTALSVRTIHLEHFYVLSPMLTNDLLLVAALLTEQLNVIRSDDSTMCHHTTHAFNLRSENAMWPIYVLQPSIQDIASKEKCIRLSAVHVSTRTRLRMPWPILGVSGRLLDFSVDRHAADGSR
jgi:hypothetical protein